jgi:hypothetical protein
MHDLGQQAGVNAGSGVQPMPVHCGRCHMLFWQWQAITV